MATNLELELLRRWITANTTIGELSVDGRFECFILEDVRRPGAPKIPGKTCIPEGRYRVQRTFSPKFGRMMPLLWNVKTSDGRLLVQGDGKTFEGIRIHWGNKAPDTDGCLLTGRQRDLDAVELSRVAFDPVDAKIAQAEAELREVWITVKLATEGERALC